MFDDVLFPELAPCNGDVSRWKMWKWIWLQFTLSDLFSGLTFLLVPCTLPSLRHRVPLGTQTDCSASFSQFAATVWKTSRTRHRVEQDWWDNNVCPSFSLENFIINYGVSCNCVVSWGEADSGIVLRRQEALSFPTWCYGFLRGKEASLESWAANHNYLQWNN